VALTKSKLFNEDNNPVFVSNATITIADDAGNSFPLTESNQAGFYFSQPAQGIPGRTYRLEVTVDGIQYRAQSYMPYPVVIDSNYYIDVASFDNPDDISKRPYCIILDPIDVENYYLIRTYINGKLDGGFRIYSDRLWNGKPRT
jgi:hypothetical protein